MAIRKVSSSIPKTPASEMPAAQPAAAKTPRKRVSTTVKPAPTPEVKPAAVAVATPPKPRATRAAKPVIKPAATPVATPEQAKPAKPAKIKRAKLVRDSFTIPEAEHAVIAGLKKRCLTLGVAARKSEVLRAALAVLARQSDAEVAAAIQALAVIKTGRPAKGNK